MPAQRKALVVHYAPGHPTESLDELTTLLNNDWRILSSSAMGGTGGATAPAQFAALVVQERDEKKTVGGFSAG